MDWLGLARIGLAWLGVYWMWIGLDCSHLDWIGLDWLGLGWIALDWLGAYMESMNESLSKGVPQCGGPLSIIAAIVPPVFDTSPGTRHTSLTLLTRIIFLYKLRKQNKAHGKEKWKKKTIRFFFFTIFRNSPQK